MESSREQFRKYCREALDSIRNQIRDGSLNMEGNCGDPRPLLLDNFAFGDRVYLPFLKDAFRVLEVDEEGGIAVICVENYPVLQTRAPFNYLSRVPPLCRLPPLD